VLTDWQERLGGKKMPVELSVIVLTNNRPQRCADSIRRNAEALKGIEAEILVINNGQQPVTLPDRMGDISCRLIQMPYNMGAVARNAGLKASTGPFILVLDDDAYIDPGLGHAMIDLFRADPRIGAVAFRIMNSKGEEACLLPTVFHGCACGFRRSALENTGGYPDGYLYYGEEYDLSFRLYQAGYRIALCNHGRMVHHVRDGGGRDTGHIMRLLIRNNIYLWFAFFPWHAIWPAVIDTLQRYYLIAIKEDAMNGFRAGLKTIPSAIWRGLCHRRPLSRKLLDYIALLTPLYKIVEELHRRQIREVILCGVGKFPTLWLRELRRKGIRVKEVWDFNTCWQGRRISGVPVKVVDSALSQPLPHCHFLTGTASLADNLRWKNYFASRPTSQAPEEHARELQAEMFSAGGIFDLHDMIPFQIIFPHKDEQNERYQPMASPLLSCMAAE
jgi:GT2 family glycosyltransferase